MKRIISLFCALALLLALAACGAKPDVSDPVVIPDVTAIPTAVPAPEATEAPEGGVPPVLSPGAAEDSALSLPFQVRDGALYTGAAEGDGVVFLGDILPIGEGYVSSLLFSDAGTFAAVKEYYFSVDPSALVLYPVDGGEPVNLAEGLVPSSRFALAGDALFWLGWEDGALWRLDMSTGEAETVSDGVTDLFAAAGGFLYYAKDGALYRNDSTGAAEVKLFATAGIGAIAAEGHDLCLLLGTADGTAGVLEFRGADGTLTARAELAEPADNILCRDGKLYVPQVAAGSVLVFDMAAAEEIGTIPLDTPGPVCVLHEVADGALYYETALDTGFVLCRVPLDGGPAEVVGSIIM